MTIICVTGHRMDKLGGYATENVQKLEDFAYKILKATRPRPEFVITGMALGWDQAIAQACIWLTLPFKAYIPFAGQESKWPHESQRLYRYFMKMAAETVVCSPPGYSAGKMHVRNRRMIDDSEKVLALWNGDDTGGTASAVKYANSVGTPVENFWDSWTRHV